MTSAPQRTRTALTIAGSDSGGGAGIQADLKTFTAFSVFGTSVLTALTAQNTRGVQAISAVDPDFVVSQCDSVLEDIGADAVKTGMLFSAPIISAVAGRVKKHNLGNLVVDPVMVSSSGHRLLDESAVEALATQLLPLATLITPNTVEAEVLVEFAGKGAGGQGQGTGTRKIDSVEGMKNAARTLHTQLGLKGSILLKGGHLPVSGSLPGETADTQVIRLPGPAPLDSNGPPMTIVDLLYDGQSFILYPKPYHRTRNLHGTGCTLSAAITAGFALGKPVKEAVEGALVYLNHAIASKVPFSVGTGAHGPVNHLHSIGALPVVQAEPAREVELVAKPQQQVPSPISAEATALIDRFIASCKDEWSQFVDHEFVRKLGDGTLPVECFKHYLTQDYIYLIHFARAHALAAYKEHHMDDIVKTADIVSKIGKETMLVHVPYCAEWGISLEELENTTEAVPNLSYSRFFLEKGISGDRLDLRVAMAPCFFGYAEIGKRLYEDPKTKREGNPYWKWIESYAAEDFQDGCREDAGGLLHGFAYRTWNRF